MGISRWIHNLIVDVPFLGAKRLRLVDLRRQLFNDSSNRSKPVQHYIPRKPVADDCHQMSKMTLADTLMMERIQISSPIFTIQASPPLERCGIDCFHLSDSKLVLADHSGRMFLCDAYMRSMVTMPSLQKQKLMPISIFVPSANADDHSTSGSLYVMESMPKAEKVGCSMPSDQFEVFEYRKPSRTYENPWHCRSLIPPPFVRDCNFAYPKISSYAVIGSNICISTLSNDTYFLDTASHTWTELGFGKLPFCGQVKYVPELKLWFGISSKDKHLVAADLADMDSQPQVIGDWREFEPPPGWEEYGDSQLVHLGLGRFCIARFLSMTDADIFDRNSIVVFTGVEVMLAGHDVNCSGSGNRKVKLQMKRHKSRFYVCRHSTIDAVF